LIVECVIVFILLFHCVKLNIVAVAVLQICDKGIDNVTTRDGVKISYETFIECFLKSLIY